MGRVSRIGDHGPPRWGALIAFVAIAFLPSLVGMAFAPGEWYRSLAKPAWNPPDWIFGPVWTALYLLIGLSGWFAWRAWRAASERRSMLTARPGPFPYAAFGVQLLLNAAWTPVFFGLQRPGWALVVILALAASIAVLIRQFARLSRPAAWLLVPYLAWVAFAAVLNFEIWRLNP
jgi:translocator protein